MPIDLKMPALSPTMEKGTLAKWLVAVGDSVKSGDLIAEIETDKATMEFEAVDEGVIASLVVAEGTDDVPVGTVIATLASEGELVMESVAAASAPVAPKIPVPEPEDVTGPAALAQVVAKNNPVLVGPISAPAVALPDDAPINATPLARRIAAAQGMKLGGITGTGTRGRIVKADVLPPLHTNVAAPATAAMIAPLPAPQVSQGPPVGVPVETIKLSTMRKTIARRLTESKQTVPHFYLTARCRLDAMLALRSDLNASLSARGIKLSVNDLLIKAMALAMVQVPDANVQFAGDEMYRFGRVDISMAVAIDGGLVTPVIRDAGVLSLSAIAQGSKALAAKARDGKLVPEDYQGGTASISNLGMFGIDEMFPVINPPQALILGVGAGVEQPWKVNGDIALATIIALTASFDHRAIDGAVAAQFMAALRELVENPMQVVS
jgi:pyruvate dehydrogenase E2 component (dihydrolipoamide acetyltransferase)